MAYLNLDFDYFDHPQTQKMIELLGRGAEAIPVKLWIRCARFHAKDGRLTGYSPQQIEGLTGWWGQSGKCVDALMSADYLGKDKRGFYAKNWKKHQGHIWGMRERNKLVARARWMRFRDEKLKSTKRVPKSTSGTNLVVPLSVPILSVPIQTDNNGLAADGGKRDAFHTFMDAFLVRCNGLKPGEPEPTERAAVNAAYRRYGRAGRDVLALARGDPEVAIKATVAIGRWLESRGLSWTLDTVAKWVPDWLGDPGRFDGKNTRK